MKVNLDLSRGWQGLISPEKVEKKYNVKFVCEIQLQNRFGWRDQSSLLFYSEEAHPQGSNYMAIHARYGEVGPPDLVITDGISALDGNIIGLIDGDEVIYSRFRHDYRVGKNTGDFIDGGRDYIRGNVLDKDRYVDLEIVDGVLKVKE